MSRYTGGWAPYVPVAERRRKAVQTMEKLRKKGHPVAPVTIEGRQIATTFWGRAWCDNMEAYRDYESRLPRGRTYVRNGSVVDLQIAAGRISATVSGSELYTVSISIKEAVKTQWQAICAACAGGIDSVVELLQGRFSKGVMERLCRQDSGLFPRPPEIRFTCSCPDHALMCKHVAATLYGVGARLDQKPELLFRLRAVDESDLVARIDTGFGKAGKASAAKVLNTADVSAIFGLDMADVAATPAPQAKRPVAKPTPAKPLGSRPVVAKPVMQKPISVKLEPARSRAAKQVVVPEPAKRPPVKPVVPPVAPKAVVVRSAKPSRPSKTVPLPQKPVPRPAVKARGTR